MNGSPVDRPVLLPEGLFGVPGYRHSDPLSTSLCGRENRVRVGSQE